MRNINFNNKETYLGYRSIWKAQYKKLSQSIREQKLCIRSQHTPSGTDYYSLKCMKEEATNMLAERKASKVEAQRQYLINKGAKQSLALA